MANVVFLIYDVTNENTFEDVKGWVMGLQQKNTEDQRDQLIYLIGNKIDLKNKRVVT